MRDKLDRITAHLLMQVSSAERAAARGQASHPHPLRSSLCCAAACFKDRQQLTCTKLQTCLLNTYTTMHSPSRSFKCHLQCNAGPWPWAEALSEDDDETWLSSGASTPDSVEEAPHANGALPNGAAAVDSSQHMRNEDAGQAAAQNGGLAVTGVLRGALGGLGLPEGLRGLQVSLPGASHAYGSICCHFAAASANAAGQLALCTTCFCQGSLTH